MHTAPKVSPLILKASRFMLIRLFRVIYLFLELFSYPTLSRSKLRLITVSVLWKRKTVLREREKSLGPLRYL